MQKTDYLPCDMFVARLTEYIMDHHPHRTDDVSFIRQRADSAARAFEQASLAGESVAESMHQAETVLFSGLLFSPFVMVRDVCIAELGYNEDDDELDAFSLQMLDMLMPLVDSYGPGDDFQGSTRYVDLYKEMTDSINQYLLRNGLQ